MTRLAFLLAALLAALAPCAASAAYNCSISSPGFAAAYDPTSRITNVTQTQLTITCTRSLSDPSTMDLTVRADNGLHPRGGNRNRAAFGRSYVNYDLYEDAACGTQWGGNSALSDTIDFGGSLTATDTLDYWGCIPARQTGLRAGTYTDLVTMTLTYGPYSSIATGTLGVTIVTPASCRLTTAPGSIVFNYVAFGPTVNASTSYGVTCTTYLPYSMALDATAGTLLGLNYTIALGTPAATGTGVEQTFSINGSIAAGQGGTCGSGTCSASQGRTLTLTY
ncbi:MAG TPA: spore coat protein U domain-containing protein [Usitatibacter sp.]|nr:spore coat protein U domain-containing protein [Usitatibacter sp.]